MLPALAELPDRLTDGAIRIRRYSMDDLVPLCEAARASWREVGPWLTWCRQDLRNEEQAVWLESQLRLWDSGQQFEFAIEDVESGHYLGGVGINRIQPLYLCANIGYWLRSDAMGRGNATRAARLVARYGLEILGLARLDVLMAVENEASRQVAERMGATLEGTLRKRLLLHGRLHDAFLYSVVTEANCPTIPRWVQERSERS